LNFSATKQFVEGLSLLPNLQGLAIVLLSLESGAFAGVSALTNLTYLHCYNFRPATISLDDFRSMAVLTSLQGLCFSFLPISTSEQLVSLTTLTNLRVLSLREVREQAHPHAFSSLWAALTNLTYLDLELHEAWSGQVDETTFGNLPSQLTNLNINFKETSVSKGLISKLATLTNLKQLELWVPKNETNYEALKALTVLKNLEKFEVDGVPQTTTIAD